MTSQSASTFSGACLSLIPRASTYPDTDVTRRSLKVAVASDPSVAARDSAATRDPSTTIA